MTSQLNIIEYSEKAFVLRGDTNPHKDQILKRRGKWNPNLTGGAGWIFSNRHMAIMKLFVSEVNRGIEPTPLLKKQKRESAIKIPILDNTNRKRKADEVVRERYESKLRKKFREELESEIRAEYNQICTFHFPTNLSFSVGVNKGECAYKSIPVNLRNVNRDRVSLSRCDRILMIILTLLTLMTVVIAVNVQMDYLPFEMKELTLSTFRSCETDEFR
jgi:hypothetical protein